MKVFSHPGQEQGHFSAFQTRLPTGLGRGGSPFLGRPLGYLWIGLSSSPLTNKRKGLMSLLIELLMNTRSMNSLMKNKSSFGISFKITSNPITNIRTSFRFNYFLIIFNFNFTFFFIFNTFLQFL